MINQELFVQNVRTMLENNNCGVVSDGNHTFEKLYHDRAVLTAALFNAHAEMCWKAKRHHDGSMYSGYFIVGIDTPFGQATYHYSLDYWPLFHVKELDRAPEWDGHTPEQAIDRIERTFC